MTPLLLMMACAVGGKPASPGSPAAEATEAIGRSAEHARVVLAEAGRMQELSAELRDPAQRDAMRAALALARQEQTYMERELNRARSALSRDP
ncbi:MAG: hypothetical protein H6741_23540 [Alphaproteobacteria bacterium]|nr:hypothetical protein [Alphaproteobacteria bacterium]MCB9795681.1 hypothetical protein [Alphaproteobacteria bacterium]